MKKKIRRQKIKCDSITWVMRLVTCLLSSLFSTQTCCYLHSLCKMHSYVEAIKAHTLSACFIPEDSHNNLAATTFILRSPYELTVLGKINLLLWHYWSNFILCGEEAGHINIYHLLFLSRQITNRSTVTINLWIITLQHVSTLSCHLQGARIHYLAKLHKYFNCSCWQ